PICAIMTSCLNLQEITTAWLSTTGVLGEVIKHVAFGNTPPFIQNNERAAIRQSRHGAICLPLAWHSACSIERKLHEQCGSSGSLLMGGAAFPIESGPLHTPHGQGTAFTSLRCQTWVSK